MHASTWKIKALIVSWGEILWNGHCCWYIWCCLQRPGDAQSDVTRFRWSALACSLFITVSCCVIESNPVGWGGDGQPGSYPVMMGWQPSVWGPGPITLCYAAHWRKATAVCSVAADAGMAPRLERHHRSLWEADIARSTASSTSVLHHRVSLFLRSLSVQLHPALVTAVWSLLDLCWVNDDQRSTIHRLWYGGSLNVSLLLNFEQFTIGSTL